MAAIAAREAYCEGTAAVTEDRALFEFLAKRLRRAISRSTNLHLSRRGFLTAAGATAVVPSAAGARAALDLFGPSVPTARLSSGLFRLQYRRLKWEFEPAAFGSSARVIIRQRAFDLIVRLLRAKLPGTDLRADFQMTVRSRGGRWLCRMEMPYVGLSAEMPLDNWLSGASLEGKIRASRWAAGSGAVQHGPGTLLVRSGNMLTLEYCAPTIIAGQIQGEAAGLTLAVERSVRNSDHMAASGTGRHVTTFALTKPALRQKAYACVGSSNTIAIRAGDLEAAEGEFARNGLSSLQRSLLIGPVDIQVFNGGVAETKLKLDRAASLIDGSFIAVSGDISRTPFPIGLRGCSARLRGGPDLPPFEAVFREGARNPFRASLNVERVHLPLQDGDEAVVLPAGTSAILSVGLTAGHSNTDLLIEGNDISALRLDDSRIEISRGTDLLDLTFQFKGFELKRRWNGSSYLRRVRQHGVCEPAMVTLLLPPQHVTESTIDFEGVGCPVPKAEHTSIAEPSRIVFKLDGEKSRRATWRMVPLTIKALTDWSDLEKHLSIARRAKAGDDLDTQLDSMGFSRETLKADLPEVLEQIGRAFQPPGDDETSLELADKLVFSPGPGITWEFPDPPKARLKPLFGIRIGRTTDTRLRAIWSRRLTPGQLPSTTPDAQIALDWGIVSQTSVGGLPALRRGVDDQQQSPGINQSLTKVPRGNVVRPATPPRYIKRVDELLELHRPRPAGQAPTVPAPPEAGIALTTTFDYADIQFTTFGATARMEWRQSPPIYQPTTALDFRPTPNSGAVAIAGTALQRLFYSEFLDQDETILQENKGFLLPIGFPATFLKTQKRGYIPDLKRPGSLIAANVITRRIITCCPVKTFPALNQPDAARDWPASNATLLTDTTPPLINPDSAQDALRQLTEQRNINPEAIFWPRIRANATEIRDVEWRVQIERDATPMTAQMIFIDNSVIGVDDVVGAVVDIYNHDALGVTGQQASWPPSNTARLYGTRRRYADPSDKADTSFDTDSWLLTGRGRVIGGQQSYIMDARMNGADQPPFYPSVRRTKISVQSVDRLVGAPQGLIECMPDPIFVGDGFSGKSNDPEIFLDVISPKIAFSLVGTNETTVGVAQPRSFVAALSRLNGIVGGAERPDTSRSLVRSMGTTSTDLAFDFGNARQNKFDKKEAFNGAFVILGVNLIDLILNATEDTLDQGPKLIEQFSYGVDAAGGDLVDGVKSIVNAAADVADQAFNSGGQCGPQKEVCGQLEMAIDQLDQNLASSKLTFAILYPDFYQSYQQAKTVVPSALRGVGTANDLPSLSTEASKALVAIKPFISAVETLVENPVPQAFEGVIDQLKTAWQTLQDVLIGGLAGFLDSVAKGVISKILIPAFASATSDELEIWLGIDVAPTEILKLLLDPSARADLARAFAYEQIGKPLIQIAMVISDLLQGLHGQIMLGRRSLERQYEGLVRDAELAIASKIDPTCGITDPVKQSALSSELLTAVEAALAGYPPPDPPDPPTADALKVYLNGLPKAVQTAVAPRLRQVLATHPGWFVGIDGNSNAAVLSAFVDSAIDKVTAAAVSAVKDASDIAVAAVNQFAVEADHQVQLLSNTLVNILTSVIDIDATARISDAARQLTGWCTAADGALAVALAFGDSLLTDAVAIDQRVADLVNVATGIAAPTAPPAAVQAFTDARKALLAAANLLADANASLTSARTNLGKFAADDACAVAASLVKSVDLAIKARNVALSTVLDVVRAYAKMATVRVAPMVVGGSTIADLGNVVRKLILDVTTIGKAGASAEWTHVSSAVAMLKSDLSQFADYTNKLDAYLTKLETDASQLRSQIAAADPALLAVLASQIAIDYVADDQRLAAAVLQTVIFSSATLQKFEAASLPMIKGVAGALSTFEGTVATSADAVNRAISESDLLSYLIHLASSDDLTASIKALSDEVTTLNQVSAASTASDAITVINPVMQNWRAGHIPLVDVFDEFVHIVNVLFQGNIAQLVGADIRAMADQLKQELADAIKQFVPTRVETGYDWKTQLGSSDYFTIDDDPEDDSEDHLTLSSRVSYDFMSRTSTAEMHGRLHSFAIMLPKMATIHFGPATFTGGTGKKTAFDVKVRYVDIGDYLKFLDELKSWMAPSGNGVYVVPALDSIRVGYQYASDLIMVGDLEFMNIAIDVFAALPFGPGAARFGFNFASEDRPFIIACAPYGGGGYLQIEMEAGGSIQNLALSFVFGAAVAISFGFLSGYGRISAGFAMIKHGSGLTIQAIVEAVGEGHIACFSLSIFIRIVLQHSSDGNLDGFATYSFSFKVGFFKLHYAVTAHRHISGPGGNTKSPQQRLQAMKLVEGAPRAKPEPTFTIDTGAPVKSRAWKKYRRHIALDLIDDHW